MPYTESQNALFRAAAHDPAIAKAHDLSQSKAAELASEGIKSDNSAPQEKPKRRITGTVTPI